MSIGGVRRVSGLLQGTFSHIEEPHADPHISLKKRTPTLSWKTPTLSLRVSCTELATKGSESATTGSGPLFQWDVGISVGFSTETTGFLPNPWTRRTPSYQSNICFFYRTCIFPQFIIPLIFKHLCLYLNPTGNKQ